VPSMAVFCSSLTSCFPGMLLTYFLNDFEIVPVAPTITGVTFVFAFHLLLLLLLLYLFHLIPGHTPSVKPKFNIFFLNIKEETS